MKTRPQDLALPARFVDRPAVDALIRRVHPAVPSESANFQPAFLFAAIKRWGAASQISPAAGLFSLIEDRDDLRRGEIQQAKCNQFVAGGWKTLLQPKEVTIVSFRQVKEPLTGKEQAGRDQVCRLFPKTRGTFRIVESSRIKNLMNKRFPQLVGHGPLLAFGAIIGTNENRRSSPDSHLPATGFLTGIQNDANSETPRHINGVDRWTVDADLTEQHFDLVIDLDFELMFGVE
jgi:hypothetical protein